MKIFNLLVISLIVLVSSNFVYAVGLSGANFNEKHLFSPDTTIPFSYVLLSDQRVDNLYTVFAEGELKQYVTFAKTEFRMEKGTAETISGTINLPASLAPPGEHYAKICVVEECPQQGMVCGRASVCAVHSFKVLHPGIMPLISFIAKDTNQDTPANFIVNIENIGLEQINKASGRVEVLNINKERLGTVTLTEKSIPSNSKESLTGVFDTKGLLPGNYSATAFVGCDNIETVLNASFRIGDLNIKIKGYTKELETGGIKRFIVSVESGWNDPLDIYAKIKIYDGENEVNTQSPTVKLQPWQTMDIESFIDTSKFTDKEYDVKIEVFYAEKKAVVDGKVKLTTPPEIGPASAVQEKPGVLSSSSSLTIILIIAVILLTLINIFLAVYRKKKE